MPPPLSTMAKPKTEKASYSSMEFEAELARLKPLLGQLTTNNKIRAACREREKATFGGDETKVRADAFWEYLRRLNSSADGNPQYHKVWDEITLYDRMGATSQDLVDGELLGQKAFVELGLVVDTWKRLDGDRGLWLVVDCEELSAAKIKLEDASISGADFLRIFLKLEKFKSGVEKWTVPALYEVRCRLHKYVLHMEGVRAQNRDSGK